LKTDEDVTFGELTIRVTSSLMSTSDAIDWANRAAHDHRQRIGDGLGRAVHVGEIVEFAYAITDAIVENYTQS
jgi:hypothetical protein